MFYASQFGLPGLCEHFKEFAVIYEAFNGFATAGIKCKAEEFFGGTIGGNQFAERVGYNYAVADAMYNGFGIVFLPLEQLNLQQKVLVLLFAVVSAAIIRDVFNCPGKLLQRAWYF